MVNRNRSRIDLIFQELGWSSGAIHRIQVLWIFNLMIFVNMDRRNHAVEMAEAEGGGNGSSSVIQRSGRIGDFSSSLAVPAVMGMAETDSMREFIKLLFRLEVIIFSEKITEYMGGAVR